MNKGKSNKKFAITVVSLCIAFLAVVGAIIGVWAATNQTINAAFKVEYAVGENVAAKVRTEYLNNGNVAIANNDKDGNKQTDDDGFIVFNAPEDATTKEIYIGDFNLTPENKELVFYFTIQNIQEAGYISPQINIEFTTQKNVSVEYFYNASAVTTKSSSEIENWSDVSVWASAIAPGNSYAAKVVISITNENASASCAGDVELVLNYAATQSIS